VSESSVKTIPLNSVFLPQVNINPRAAILKINVRKEQMRMARSLLCYGDLRGKCSGIPFVGVPADKGM
jgi:hypothetical protein